MRLPEQTKITASTLLVKSHALLLIAFCLLGAQSQAQIESCDALEGRLTALMSKVSKEESQWVKKKLIPTLCAVPEAPRWVAKVDSVVTVMEDNRAAASGEIRNYLYSVWALCA